jgi:parallel beta-helix repeat protein
MRYIGRTNQQTLVQVDPDVNSYVNVRSFGAAGLDQYFEGRVRGVGGNGGIISVGDIPNYSTYERDYFQIGQELYAFFYLDTSTPDPGEYDGLISNLGIEPVGQLVQAGAATARTLQYFVFAFNPRLGKLSPYRKTFILPNVYKDPLTQFDAENYIRLTFTRQTSDWLPVIFRQWGNGTVRFVGIPSNNIFGSNTSVTFNDRGSAEIPTWDEAKLNVGAFFPQLLNGIISYGSDSPTSKTIITKRRLRIVARSLTGVLECVDTENQAGDFTALDSLSIRVKFKFDDTNAFQEAINFAAVNRLKDVFIPSGTYSVRNLRLYSSTIPASEYSGLVLRGSGEGSVVKKMATAVNPQNQYGLIGLLGSGITNRVSGITVSSMSFDGNKTETFPLNPPENDTYGVGDKYNDTLALEYADSIRVSNCSFYNGAGSAIYALDSDKITLSNNRIFELSKPFELNIPPLKIRESSRIIAQGNLFENCSGAVDFTGIDASVINNNIINNCGETGLELKASETWNAQGNLTFNESGSIIRTIDLYQNEYSRVSLDVKKGVPMTPVFFTVTDGGFPVDIAPGSVVARVYALNSSYAYNTSATATYLQVVESNPQLQAGIFAITAPVVSITGVGGSNQGRAIRGTNSYDLLDEGQGRYGYGYRLTATVALGRYPVDRITYASSTTIRVFFRNSADILSLLFFAAGNASNDSIRTSGIGLPNSELAAWPDGTTISIQSVDTANSALVLNTPASVASKFLVSGDFYTTPTGFISLVKNNYFIADGNIYVSE